MEDYVFTALMEQWSSQRPVKFIQIGANDGKSHDPVYGLCSRYKWSGILVEPVPFIYRQLQGTYRNIGADLLFENVAISDETTTATFYSFAENAANLPPHAHALGSLDKSQLLAFCKNEEHRASIVEETVECMTLMQLCEKHKSFDYDLLVIDAETYDYRILSSIDFERFKPSFIYYEHMGLTAEEKKSAEELLLSQGYKLYMSFIPRVSVAERNRVAVHESVDTSDYLMFQSMLEMSGILKEQSGVVDLVTVPGTYETVVLPNNALNILRRS